MSAKAFQIKGASVQKDAVRRKIADAISGLRMAMHDRDAGLAVSRFTLAFVLRKADVSRKTLLRPYHMDSLELVEKFLLEADMQPNTKSSLPMPARTKKPTFFERMSILAQEAEAVRYRMQRQIDELSAKLTKISRGRDMPSNSGRASKSTVTLTRPRREQKGRRRAA